MVARQQVMTGSEGVHVRAGSVWLPRECLVGQMGDGEHYGFPIVNHGREDRDRNGDEDREMHGISSVPFLIYFEKSGNKRFTHLHQGLARLFSKGPDGLSPRLHRPCKLLLPLLPFLLLLVFLFNFKNVKTVLCSGPCRNRPPALGLGFRH